MKVCVAGFGTVGRWLVAALDRQAGALRRDGVEVELVAVANRHDGLVYHREGLSPAALTELAEQGGSLTDYPGVDTWPDVAERLRSLELDVLVETSASPRESGDPGLTHIREALRRGIDVVTSNKWPVALAGVELVELAAERGVELRAESTVMSGTPVLRALADGLAGATPRRLRGVVNATANAVLTTMSAGSSYEDAVSRAQAAGLAEPDPAADLEGWDSVAKLMILSALIFGHQLAPADVRRRGIASLRPEEVSALRDPGAQLREVADLVMEGSEVSHAAVEPALLDLDDPLAAVDGATNSIIVEAEPLGEVRIVGPGAGAELAGQGVLSDLISIGRRRRNDARHS
jgi:homoserine dehydrogenase